MSQHYNNSNDNTEFVFFLLFPFFPFYSPPAILAYGKTVSKLRTRFVNKAISLLTLPKSLSTDRKLDELERE